MKPQPESSTSEVLAGLVERVTYHNAENGFCVLRAKARGHRELVTVVGHAAIISAGEWITASGEWINDRTHGQQFKARFMRTSAPTSIDGIEKYLSSGMIRGIGPVYAKKMIKAFGERVFDIIEAEPDRLREVDGIGPIRAKRITDAWAEQKIVREIMVFLHSHGVGTARAVRIYKTYGADAVQVMTENPYRLARDIRGIGFKTADAIAMKLGIEKTAMIRVRAGVSYALTEAMDEGHCGLPTDELVPLAVDLLEVPKELVLTALDLELAEGAVIADTVGETRCIFLGGLYRAEQVIAERILRLANETLPWPYIDPEKALWIEQRTGLLLAERQVAAIRLALVSKVLVITGGPGVGKTHYRQFHTAHSVGEGRHPAALRPDGPCREAHDRGDGVRGQDDPPDSRGRPQVRGLQTQQRQPARLRSVGRRRDLDGRRHADAGSVESGPRECRAAGRR
jgi:exodeoxyribonuclease V alpha subunit